MSASDIDTALAMLGEKDKRIAAYKREIATLRAERDEWKAKYEWAAGKLHKAAEADKWISVEERLPEAHATVLIYGSHTKPSLGFVSYFDSGWIDSIDGERITGVTHWRPLPAPPEEEV